MSDARALCLLQERLPESPLVAELRDELRATGGSLYYLSHQAIVRLDHREAADSVGMSKAAIFKAIRTGKMSAQKNPNGEWQIEPVELFRVFDPVHSIHSNGHSNGHSEIHDGQYLVDDGTQPIHLPSIETLQVTITQLETRLQEMTLARDALVTAKDELIGDLRQRLDQSQAQVSQLTAIIAQVQPPKAKPGWWARLLGGQ
jgi:hypothetical protein